MNLHRTLPLVAATLALVTLAPAARAQTWRTMDVSRQVHDSSPIDVRLKYGAGRLDLRPATAPVLYDVYMRYDADRAEPKYSYSESDHVLDAGLSHAWTNASGNKEANEMRVTLARGVPIDLTLDLGASQAAVDLTGLLVRSIKVEGGASETTIRFDSVNAIAMHDLDVRIGAASLHAINLANANVDHIQAEAGVGELNLDFGGTWTRDLDVDARVTIGAIRINVPSDIGVQVEMQKFAASVDLEGMQKQSDNLWVSDNWSTAKYHLRIHAQTTFGSMELHRDSR